MPALPGGLQRQGQVALLRDIHHRQGHAGEQGIIRDQHAALVHHPGKVQPQFPHTRGQRRGAAGAADLLIVAEGKHHAPLRRKALRQQSFDRLQQAHQADLVIQGATAIDPPVRHYPAEGRVLPVLFCTRLHRHHVHMGGEQHRGQRGVTARPAQQQAVVVDRLHLQFTENQWKRLPQELVKPDELSVINLAVILVADGLETHRLSQPLGG